MTDEALRKQEAEQAPPVTTPGYISNVQEEMKNIEKDNPVELRIREEQILEDGSQSDFWLLLKKILERRIEKLHKAQSIRLGTGQLNLEEIGLKALIINEVADAFQTLINTVELKKKKANIPNDTEEVNA